MMTAGGSATKAGLIGIAAGVGVGVLVLLAVLFLRGGDDDNADVATESTTALILNETTTAPATTAAPTQAPTTAPTTAPATTVAPTTAVPTTTAATTTTTTTTAGVSNIVLPLPQGQYCYRFTDSENDLNYRVSWSNGGLFAGDARISQQSPEYSAFGALAFNGVPDDQPDRNATADVTLWIEGDVQETTEAWVFGSDQLDTGRTVLALTDCSVVDAVFEDLDGLEANDLLEDITIRVDEEVKFDAGAGSASRSNAVIVGERDVYRLGATSGQQMTVEITSLEDNAVFAIVSPSGLLLANEETNASVFLPHNGDYRVIVGGTRGNATYEVTFSIE